jgi:hypothetical protein
VKASNEKLTRASAMMGTPAYMAPEQALGRVDDIDHRTDQWALACLAWEMLAGSEPFAGKDTPTVLYAIAHQEPPPLAAPDLPAEVEPVLRRALSKRQGDRFPTITAFVRAFAAAAEAKATVAATPAPRPRTPAPAVVSLGARVRAWLPVTRKRRKPGVVGMTVAMGKRAIEELIPRRREPRRWTRWLAVIGAALLAVGVALAGWRWVATGHAGDRGAARGASGGGGEAKLEASSGARSRSARSARPTEIRSRK